MTSNRAVLYAILVAGVIGLTVAGCQKKEGPAERAGAQIDQAANNLTGDKGPAQKAGEKIDEAAGKVGEKVEEAGETIQKKAGQ